MCAIKPNKTSPRIPGPLLSSLNQLAICFLQAGAVQLKKATPNGNVFFKDNGISLIIFMF